MIAPSSSDSPVLYQRRTAVIFAGAMVLGFVLLIATVGMDRSRRTNLESVHERTAVGDRNYVVVAEKPQEGAAPLTAYQGKELRSAGNVEVRDVRMLRVAPDDSGRFTLYRARDEDLKDSEGERLGDGLFLKRETDQYVKVK